jgi:predicted nucleic acid-binding protein
VILLDTCVISEFAKAAPAPALLAWMDSVPDDALRLSVLTLGEIRKGADLLEPGPRRARIEAWLEGLRHTFADRILPVDQEVALRWGTIRAAGRRNGRVRPPVDSLIAATAVCHDLTLATRNVADFEGTGAVVVNPWTFAAR